MKTTSSVHRFIWCIVGAWIALASCGEDAASSGPGEIGGSCSGDDDCFDGECCTNKNCGGGMCTYPCKKDDRDCPEGMSCEHEYCYFRCDSEVDCGEGQSCEHGRTICEFEKD